MSVLRRVAGHFLRDRVRSSVTREELGVELLLLHIERSQLRWLGHLFQMPPGRLPWEVFLACPARRGPRGRPRTCWCDYVTQLAWELFGILWSWRKCPGREKSRCPCSGSWPATRPRISGRKWMDEYELNIQDFYVIVHKTHITQDMILN